MRNELGLKEGLNLHSPSLLFTNMKNGSRSILRTYIADINNIHSTIDDDKVITCSTNIQYNCCVVISTNIQRHNLERAKYSIYCLREKIISAPTQSVLYFLLSSTLHLILQVCYQNRVPRIAENKNDTIKNKIFTKMICSVIDSLQVGKGANSFLVLEFATWLV